MDYSLAALKMLSFQLTAAKQTPSQNALTLGGILFQRAWLQVFKVYVARFALPLPLPRFITALIQTSSDFVQGVLVSVIDENRLILDDGTGTIKLSLSGEFRLRGWRAGELPMIKVHKMVDLSAFPDREAMWYLEVLEAYRLFYRPLIEAEEE
ncbi:hypothetical protein CDL15_Pgr025143 [Punica granatum]|uniref:Uncharacterized protein n=1 Tax=Punica granatum TaxID=22663 RepID=A0A218W8I2_PUNGR|nr:hypothetical protein CDL15_Pgr025143 [Punica granatum]